MKPGTLAWAAERMLAGTSSFGMLFSASFFSAWDKTRAAVMAARTGGGMRRSPPHAVTRVSVARVRRVAWWSFMV
jgi:hypothetical protein